MNDEAEIAAVSAEITIDAPREKVFEALLDPDQRLSWWNVTGKFRALKFESDLKPGGHWRMQVVGPDERAFELWGTYLVVERPNRVAFTWNAGSDEPETNITIELTENAKSTHVRLTHSGFLRPEEKSKYQGWPWLLNLLKNHTERNRHE